MATLTEAVSKQRPSEHILFVCAATSAIKWKVKVLSDCHPARVTMDVLRETNNKETKVSTMLETMVCIVDINVGYSLFCCRFVLEDV